MSSNVNIDEMYIKVIGILVYLNRIGSCFENKAQMKVLQSPALTHELSLETMGSHAQNAKRRSPKTSKFRCKGRRRSYKKK